MLDASDPRPILLVDVDGVLNPWLAPGCPDGFAAYEFFPPAVGLTGEVAARLADWAANLVGGAEAG